MANPDPRDKYGPFQQLFKKIKECKEKVQPPECKGLRNRAHYFEPNPLTAGLWNEEKQFIEAIDTRLVFVCESPGSRKKEYETTDVVRCWNPKHKPSQDFLQVLNNNGFENCYITNAIKCGVREKGKHPPKHIINCHKFLIEELQLIQPQVAVAVGGNSLFYLREYVIPEMIRKELLPPVLFQITHYSMRGKTDDKKKRWKKEFAELECLLKVIKPRSIWK